MTKKIISTFLFIILFSNCAIAESKNSKFLSRIENNLFGIEYATQSDTERLSRIEEQVYGESKSGSVKSRLNNLSNDIAANLMGQEITPKKDTFADEEETFPSNKVAQKEQKEEEFPATPNIDYPVLNELEEQVFGKTYKNLDINTRISKLEKQTFKKTYEDALADRVDRLKEKLAYNSEPQKEEFNPNNFHQEEYYPQDDNYFSPQTMANTENKEFSASQEFNSDVTDREFSSKLKKLEKNVFRQSYANDSIDNRLSRLEGAIFNTNFVADKKSTRLNRISSAVQAQKTAKKYDANGIQQKMATAMQIGMFVLMVVAMIL